MRRGNATVPAIVLALSVMVLVALGLLSSSSGTSDVDPSSHSNGKSGSLALYLWLQQLGLDVHRVSGEFDLSNTDMLIIDAPSVGFDSDAISAVRQHLRGGGDVLVAVDGAAPNASEALVELAGLRAVGVAPAGDAVPVQPLDPGSVVQHVPFGDALALTGGSGAVPLLQRQQGADVAVGVRPAGGGRLYLLGDMLPLSNDGLRHGDSAAFILSLIERSRGGRIAFDEFHHGEVGTTGGSTILYGPVGLAGLLVLLTVVGYLLVSGRRLGRPIPLDDPALVPSAATYVGAMAQLFERSRRRGGVADRYADELKRRVGVATGIDAHLADDAFVALLQGWGDERAAAVAGALRSARDLAVGTPGEPALLHLAQQVEQAEQRFAAGAALL